MRIRKLLNVFILVFVMGSATVVAQNTKMPQQQNIEVSDSELSEFAKVFQQMRVINQEAQQQMIQVVQDSDLKLERFNEIHQANLDPNKEAETTDAESKKYEVAVTKLETIQPKFQERMKNLIDNSSLSVERYQQLAMALQSDASLQQRLQEELKG